MQSFVTYFSRKGIPLAELVTNVTREYRLNAPGVSRHIHPHGEDLTESLIRPGGFVLVRAEGVEDWVGRISNHREWTAEGPKIQCYQAQSVLENYFYLEIDPTTQTLVTPPTLSGTVSGILTTIVEIANNYEDTRIRIGNLFGGGFNRQETITNDFLSHVGFLTGRAGYDYDVLPSIAANGELTLLLNLYEHKGIDTSSIFALEEGINIELRPEQTLTQSSKIVNRFVGIGEGVNDASRIAAKAEDAASRELYGLRMDNQIFFGVSEMNTLQANTNNSVRSTSVWHSIIRVSCNDPALFPYLLDGNSVHCVLHSYGFLPDGNLGTDVVTRILSAELEDAGSVMSLVLEDV